MSPAPSHNTDDPKSGGVASCTYRQPGILERPPLCGDAAIIRADNCTCVREDSSKCHLDPTQPMPNKNTIRDFSAASPRELVAILTQGVIAHRYMRQRDQLHGNITPRHIMVDVTKSQECDHSPLGSTDKPVCSCVMLVDPDPPIHCSSPGNPNGIVSHRPLPFTSMRIIRELARAWKDIEPCIPTVHDDLESFAWILVWEYTMKARERESDDPTSVARWNYKYLSSTDHCTVEIIKQRMWETEDALRSFTKLFHNWVECAQNKAFFEDEVYDAFVQIAGRHLEAAEYWGSWEDFFTGKKKECVR
ncbi:hypothetical protein BXZ70DRAFT_463930 [Cristinia sonorae]|uniref:Fungal-type protein kinase domain-containing protein n=1 Tax=Cristinia sonorae TaxID=1940300 RepID=A0A8K0XLY9_9AGAR|nr:hypothetical protein BXZ70DRAFT_463930 [Cristinia sonorae]